MFFRIFMGLILLVAGYAAYKVISIQQYYETMRNPLAEFTVLNEGNHSEPAIVEFMNYECVYCKATHLVLLDYARKNPDVRYVVRPVPFANNGAETAAERALAAGLQGKFREMDEALAAYGGVLNERFYREQAALFDIDYDRMVREAEEETVQDMAGDNAQATIAAELTSTPAFMVGKTVYQLEKPLTLPDLIRMVQTEKTR